MLRNVSLFILILLLSACGGSGSSKPSIPSTTPVAVTDNVSTTQNQSISIAVLSNDTSPINSTLSLLSVSMPANGQASKKDDLINYTPKEGFSGVETLTYEISNTSGEKATGTVNISINNLLPNATNDVVTTAQNQVIEITPLVNDSDAIGDQISLVSATDASYGEINISENTITYEPIDGYVGTDTFTYTITDLYGDTSEANITVNIENLAPEVVDDEVKVFKNSDVTIDVLVNDSDVIGDTLTIQSLTAPQHGSAEIIDNKVHYIPEAEYIGNDVFSYTAIDNHGSATSAFIRISINNGVNVTGKLVGFIQAEQQVTIDVAGTKYSGTTDASGRFTIAIDANNTDAMVIASAENITDNYSLKAYLGDVASLLAAMDENFTVNRNLSNISTAEYELINDVVNNDVINTMDDLVAAQLVVDSNLVLKLAASAQLIYQDNSITLPSPYTSINAFMQTPAEVNKQLSAWRIYNVADYYNIFNSIMSNEQQSSLVNNIAEGSNRLLQAQKEGQLHSISNLQLRSDNSGFYVDSWQKQTLLSWGKSGNEVSVNFETPNDNIVSYQGTYCHKGVTATVNFSANSMKVKPLYTTQDYDVYIAKLVGEYNNSNCFDKSIHQYEYLTFNVAKIQPFVIEAGSYSLDGFIKSKDTNNTPYNTIASNFVFAADGSFNEVIDMPLASIKNRTGQWQNINNQLILNYDDDLTIYFDKTTHYQGVDVLNIYIKNNDEIIAIEEGFMVEKQSASFQFADGYLRLHRFPLFDENIDGGFGFKFINDGTGIQHYLTLGEANNSTSGAFSWQYTQNHFTLNYYLLNGEYVNYCDVNKDNCQQWRQRDMELIATTNDGFIFKVYQEFYNDVTPSRAGYIAFFQYLPL